MKWNKAGRPRTNPKVEQPTELDNKYTKEELKVYKDPVQALAMAVVKQWKDDGCPKQDAEGIKPWIELIKTKWE